MPSLYAKKWIVLVLPVKLGFSKLDFSLMIKDDSVQLFFESA